MYCMCKNLKFRGVTPPRNSLFYSTLYFLLCSTLLYYHLPYSTLLLYPTLLYCTLLYYSLSSLKLPSPQKLFIQTSGLTNCNLKNIYVYKYHTCNAFGSCPQPWERSQNESSMPLICSRLGVWQNQHTAYVVHGPNMRSEKVYYVYTYQWLYYVFMLLLYGHERTKT